MCAWTGLPVYVCVRACVCLPIWVNGEVLTFPQRSWTLPPWPLEFKFNNWPRSHFFSFAYLTPCTMMISGEGDFYVSESKISEIFNIPPKRKHYYLYPRFFFRENDKNTWNVGVFPVRLETYDQGGHLFVIWSVDWNCKWHSNSNYIPQISLSCALVFIAAHQNVILMLSWIMNDSLFFIVEVLITYLSLRKFENLSWNKVIHLERWNTENWK